MKTFKPKDADHGVKAETADEFRKAVKSVIEMENMEPLIYVFYDKNTDKLGYAVGSAVVKATEENKARVLNVIMRIIGENKLINPKA